jgi:iron(III) transport system substrate-binding protein
MNDRAALDCPAVSNASRSRPRTLRSIGLLGLAVVVGSSALTACGGDDSGRLTIYSGRTKELVDPLLQKFSQESGIKIDVKYGDSAQLATLIATEGDKSPADVFFSQTPSGLKFIDEQGLLTALPQSTLDRVASTDRAADGDWVATSGRVRIVAYNPDSVAGTELPSGVADLTGPAWTGAVGISPTNGSFIEFMATFAAIEGEAAAKDFLAGLKANGVKTYANNVAIIDAITRGEIKVGLINHYYSPKSSPLNLMPRSRLATSPAMTSATSSLLLAPVS